MGLPFSKASMGPSLQAGLLVSQKWNEDKDPHLEVKLQFTLQKKENPMVPIKGSFLLTPKSERNWISTVCVGECSIRRPGGPR